MREPDLKLNRRVLGKKETPRHLKPWSTVKPPWRPRLGEKSLLFSAFAKPNALLDARRVFFNEAQGKGTPSNG